MDIEYRYTRHQLARSTRADVERNDDFFLLKNVSLLRLTYQIQLLAFRASQTGRKLVIRVPSSCKLHPGLRGFQKEHSKLVRVERV